MTEIPCLHLNFNSSVGVARLVDENKPLRFRAEVQIECADCHQRFMFLGVDRIGFAASQPSLDVSRRELNMPIAPWDGQIVTHATYEFPQ